RAGEKFRRSKQVAGALTVYICTNRFRNEDRYMGEITLPLSPKTDTTPELLARAMEGLRRIYESGRHYHKAGVMLTNLSAAEALPLRLWKSEAHERERRLMQTIDKINAKFGRDTMQFGVPEKDARWQMRTERRSPHYTSRWEELLTIGKKPTVT